MNLNLFKKKLFAQFSVLIIIHNKLHEPPCHNLSWPIRVKALKAWGMLSWRNEIFGCRDSAGKKLNQFPQGLCSRAARGNQPEAWLLPIYSHPLSTSLLTPCLQSVWPLRAIDRAAWKSLPKFHLLSNPFSLPQSQLDFSIIKLYSRELIYF